MRYCRNRALSTATSNVKRAIIVIHGTGSDAERFYDLVTAYDDYQDASIKPTVLAPQFIESNDGNDPTAALGVDPYHALWYKGGWRHCQNAHNGVGTSSCEMVDFLVEKLIEYNSGLEHIVVLGYSAGAQFVNRYSMSSVVESYANSQGVTMSYGVVASGYNAYLTSTRYETIGDDCEASFNSWPFGLTNRYSYAAASSVSAMMIRAVRRHIYYIVGADDTGVSTNCNTLAQGETHVSRMWNYQTHLQSIGSLPFYGPAWSSTNSLAFKELTGVSHSSAQLFATRHVERVLFEYE